MNMDQNNVNYEKLIVGESTNKSISSIQAINLYCSEAKKCIVLSKLDESNYIDVLKYMFINKFNFNENELDNIIMYCGQILTLNTLKYETLLNNMNNGIIYDVLLKTVILR